MKKNKLKGRIVEKFDTQKNFAKALGVSPGTLSQKLKNKRKLSREEIARWCDLLEISNENLPSYFFAD